LKILSAIFFIALYACTAVDRDTDINADIYQGYRFEYSEATNETIISAVFKAGSEDGNVIRLSAPAFFTVNDDFCNYCDTVDYPYALSYASRLPEAVLNFVDFEKNEYINRVELDSLFPVRDFCAAVDSVSHGVKVSFSGSELCEGEELMLVVSAGEKEVSYDISERADNVFRISDEILKDFAGKTVCMKLYRIRTVELNDVSPAGGEVQLVYASKIKEVELP